MFDIAEYKIGRMTDRAHQYLLMRCNLCAEVQQNSVGRKDVP